MGFAMSFRMQLVGTISTSSDEIDVEEGIFCF
jgi:hypothetical protein